MTERGKIIQLARQCDFYEPGGLPSDWIDSDFMASPEQIEAFYHAAQCEAFEQAALVCAKINTIGSAIAEGQIRAMKEQP